VARTVALVKFFFVAMAVARVSILFRFGRDDRVRPVCSAARGVQARAGG